MAIPSVFGHVQRKYAYMGKSWKILQVYGGCSSKACWFGFQREYGISGYFWVRNASPTGDSVDFVLANDSIRHGVVQLLVVFHHHGVSLGSTESEHRNVNACPYANGNVCT
jgi:hypothetical protein